MNDRLDREELVSLLESLGSDNDEEVLAAARVLDTKVAAAGTSWAVLLRPGIGGDAEDTAEEAVATTEDAGQDEDGLEPASLEEMPRDDSGRNAESLALIEKLLARRGHSEDFRQELEDYKADIAAGEFKDRDHRYLRALYKRLSA